MYAYAYTDGRAAIFDQFEGAGTVFRGFTIKGCRADYGGAIFAENAVRTIVLVYMYICSYLYAYVCVHVCMYVCMYVCVYIYTHT